MNKLLSQLEGLIEKQLILSIAKIQLQILESSSQTITAVADKVQQSFQSYLMKGCISSTDQNPLNADPQKWAQLLTLKQFLQNL